MGDKVVTIMVLNTVDLNCSSCYKKVKKVLCKFPQIRDQVYDVKNNKVTIKVFCCNPEKIRDKLCCKGGKVIKSIEIVEPKAPEKPKEAENPKAPEKPKEAEKPKAPEKPKEAEKPKAPEKPKEAEKPKAPEKPKEAAKPKEAEKPKAPEKPKEAEKPKAPAEKPKAPEASGPVHGYPPMPMYPNGACCGSCAQGLVGGPCYQGYGRPVPPPPGPNGTCCGSCAQGYGGGPCYQGYGRPVPPPGPCYDYGRPVPQQPAPCYDYGYGYRGSKCCVSTDYFSEENPQGCTIM